MSFSPTICPSTDCTFHTQSGGHFIKKGFFLIKRTNQKVRKFKCTHCSKMFSSRTFKPDYRHKKKDLNFRLAEHLVEGNSLRSASRLLKLSYSNTYLKFLWLKKVIDLKKGELKFKAHKIQFDELETIHHTKCKPLSIALVVSDEHQLIAAQVAEMPAKGPLAEISRNKYGERVDERSKKLRTAFAEVKERLVSMPNLIESDQKSSYKNIVQEFFESTEFRQHNRAEKIRLQDRLHEKKQKKRFDPLFAVNHQCAFLRSQIKRLTRRSWCTTKKPENLQLHLDLFILMQVCKKF